MMPNALLIEQEAIIREPLATAFRGWGFDAYATASIAEARELLEKTDIDVLIIEPAIDGGVGFRFIAGLLSRYPDCAPAVVILTDDRTRASVIKAAKMGIRTYLLKKNFSLDNFRHRLSLEFRRKHRYAEAEFLAPDAPPDGQTPFPIGGGTSTGQQAGPTEKPEAFLSKAKARETIENYGECRALSPTFSYAMKILNDSTADADLIAKALKRDQALAMRVLQAGNSSAFKRAQPAKTVEQAVVRLGIRETRQIVMGVAVMEEFGGPEFSEYIDIMNFWEHAVATAMISQEIARAHRTMDPEEAFLAGLLHDVGRVIMVEQFGEQYARCLDHARSTGESLHRAEKQLFNIDHTDVAEILFRDWRFPTSIIDAVSNHHLSLENVKYLQPAAAGQSCTIIIADRLASAMLLGSSGDDRIIPAKEFADHIELNPATIRTIAQKIPEAVQEIKFGLAAASGMSIARSVRDGAVERIGRPIGVRAITAGDHSEITSILAAHIGGKSDKKPDALLVCINAAHEADRLTELVRETDQRLAEQDPERYRDATLPILLTHTKRVKPPADLFADRPRRTVIMPATTDKFAAALGALLEEQDTKKTAGQRPAPPASAPPATSTEQNNAA